MTATQPSELQLPLFPLAGVVHFPKTELPLHIFEPRYRQMIADLEERDEDQRLIGMALVEESLAGAAQVHRIGTAGLLSQVETLPDGRSNILLRGLFRFRIERQVGGAPYSQAQVVKLPETEVVAGAEPWMSLETAFHELLPGLALEMQDNFSVDPDDVHELLAVGSLESIVNNVAAHLEIPVSQKIRLLRLDLAERAESVLRVLREYRRSLDLLAPYRHLAGGVQEN